MKLYAIFELTRCSMKSLGNKTNWCDSFEMIKGKIIKYACYLNLDWKKKPPCDSMREDFIN